MGDLTSGNRGQLHGRSAPELTLNHLDALPTLTPIAVKLLEITADDESSVGDLVNALRADQSLTAKILAVANSPAMGIPGKVATLERAVVLLGFKAVRSLVLALKVFECFSGAVPEKQDRRTKRAELWKHSLGVACTARRLAAARPELKIDPEEAFIAGLLHDLGKVALDAVFPKAYERIAMQAEEARCDIADCERAILGVDHTVAGRYLAKRWGLPQFLQEVIWLHHVAAETLSERVVSSVLIAAVQLANTFVREHHIGDSGDYAFYEPSAGLAERLGFSTNQMEAIAPEVVSDVAEHATLLGLDQVTPETLYLRSLSSANSALGRLNADLLETNRRLAAAARYFEAITEFDRQLNASSELSVLVAAIAKAAQTALQRDRLAVFGVHDQSSAIELVCIGTRTQPRESTILRPTDEMRQWLSESSSSAGATILPAPSAVRSLIAPIAGELGKGACWLLPIVHGERIAGGIVFLSERGGQTDLTNEMDELRSFLASLGLALGRVNAQQAARRLSEDLAESNRRLQQMQAEVLRTRARAMIAEMAAGAGHELNSPLTVISGRAQMLMESVSDPKAQRWLKQIHDKAHECARIVTELMEFARPRPPQAETVDLAELLAEVRQASLAKFGLPESRLSLNLPMDSDAEPVRFLADREQITYLIDELIKNAAHAVAENNGSIEIALRASIEDSASVSRAAQVGLPPAQIPPRWAKITVRDTGCGMSPSVSQRVFDPFFSHRPAGRGRGLGLSRACRIVEAHGGRIWVESRLGEGSAFHIVLPQLVEQ